jgi:SAM-dependent methyltransferase
MSTDMIYDHPQYYDILFGFDRSQEADSYERSFLRCGALRGERVLEVAAGPARVGRLLARRGWRVTALDRSAGMLALARREAAAEGVALETPCADMTAFAAEPPFADAFNPISSFRLLHSDAEMDVHLRCVAAALRPGGVYVLDVAFVATDGEPSYTTDEGWEMTRGDVTVRGENDGVVVSDGGAQRRLVWNRGAHLRNYTWDGFAARIAGCPAFAVESWHLETARAETGVSAFDPAGRRGRPGVGRALVVLRRR